ncbi:RdgB/HAM1 family non-canonical purine NTP pyrophosphatase [Candidatus Chlorohelix sp.]|uniref:RdgB/HAM1 family non-canonical purine NTP pyrophosphatase n=1 Tax=Candidatus Chlorohelix sp. TaxID=3139201 RepID=UPI003058269C
MKILVATNNRSKLLEMARLFNIEGLELVLPADLGLKDFDVEETGQSYYENAALKAAAFARASGMSALADDSGLEVDALNGEPGLYSKRYAGENATDAYRISYLLKKLENVTQENRTARFIALLALASPDGTIIEHEQGTCEGRIGFAPTGNNGFGYDPIFLPIVVADNHSMADLSNEGKDLISHRGNAARKLAPFLRKYIEES